MISDNVIQLAEPCTIYRGDFSAFVFRGHNAAAKERLRQLAGTKVHIGETINKTTKRQENLNDGLVFNAELVDSLSNSAVLMSDDEFSYYTNTAKWQKQPENIGVERFRRYALFAKGGDAYRVAKDGSVELFLRSMVSNENRSEIFYIFVELSDAKTKEVHFRSVFPIVNKKWRKGAKEIDLCEISMYLQ